MRMDASSAKAPEGGGRIALWLDGSLEACVLATWFTRLEREWLAVVPSRVSWHPARAQAVDALLAHFGCQHHTIAAQDDPLVLPALLALITAAAEHGAYGLCLPVRRDLTQPAHVARITATNQLLAAWGFQALERPFWRASDQAIARLALALEAPLIHACTCTKPSTCQTERCVRWTKVFGALGLRDEPC